MNIASIAKVIISSGLYHVVHWLGTGMHQDGMVFIDHCICLPSYEQTTVTHLKIQCKNIPSVHQIVGMYGYGLLAKYENLRIARAPGMPGTFSPPPRVNYPAMLHDTCATHVPWCRPGSLTSGFLWSWWRGKRSRHFRRMRNPQFYVSGKRSIVGYFYVYRPLTTGSRGVSKPSLMGWKLFYHYEIWHTPVYYQISERYDHFTPYTAASRAQHGGKMNGRRGPLLLTWFNFSTNMDT